MLNCHKLRLARYIGTLVLLAVFLTSCQDNRAESVTRVLALCGESTEKTVRVYLVAVSDTKAITVSKTIELPMTMSCPNWVANSNVGWLYGRYKDGYQRDVYLLDLNQGKVSQWFQLSGDEDIKEIAFISGAPRAVIITNQDHGGCSQSNSEEEHWYCVQSGEDLYLVDAQGKRSHLIHSQLLLCGVKMDPTGRSVAVTQAHDSCDGPSLLQGSNLALVDMETRQVNSFDCNKCASPTWSPNGRYLAFLKGGTLPQKGVGAWPYIFDLEQNQTVVLDNNLEGWYIGGLAWSPDNQHLSWITTSGNQKVKIFDAAKKNIAIFQGGQYSPSFSQFSPEWSPDGEHWAWEDNTAFYFGDIKNSSVYTIPVETASVFDWTFNGNEIIYISKANAKSSAQVFMISQDNNEAFNLTDILPLNDSLTRIKWVK